MQLRFLNSLNKIYLVLIIFLISPNLFNKLNLIDNHEIFSNLNHFENYINFLFGHPEIITNFTTSTYRPFFYVIKGIEFFLFEDNSFYYFLTRSLFFVIICLIFNEITKIYLKSKINIIFLSLFVCVNPYSHDIFFRAGSQEVFVLIFFSFILLILVKDFNNLKISNSNKIIFYISLLLMGLIKEPYVIFSILFLIYSYFFSKTFKFKNKILLILILNFLIFFLIYRHYMLNGHTYGAESNYSLDSAITLLLDFFKISKIHIIFIILQILAIFFMTQKVANKYLILIIFMNIFYFSNFIVTNGWVIHRYFLVFLICIFFLLLSLFHYCENHSKKLITFYFKNFLLTVLTLSVIIYVYRTINIVNVNNDFNNKIYNKTKSYEHLEIKNNLISDDEYYLSLIIFIKNIHPKKIVTFTDQENGNTLLVKRINYDNIYLIKFETEKLSKSKKLKKACFYLKKLDPNDFCSGEPIIIK